jgi:hypothetical protein
MYRDLVVNKKIISLCINRPYHFKALNFIRKIHHSSKINGILNLPCRDIWYQSLYRSLTEIVDRDTETCVIFDTGVIANLSISFLKRIQSINDNMKMVLVIVDSMHGSSVHMSQAIPKILGYKWSLIFSYDKNDCLEYGFQYLGQSLYSKLYDAVPSNENSDIYFVGRDKKGRNKEVIHLYENFQKRGITTNFNLIGSSGSIQHSKLKKCKGINLYCKNISYEKIISDVLSTNCILEVVSKGQRTQTARYYEAVCYNKKILTNNPGIFKLPFYNSRNMQYFENVNDINFEWIKNKENIDYCYSNEFSPIHLLDKIAKNIDK